VTFELFLPLIVRSVTSTLFSDGESPSQFGRRGGGERERAALAGPGRVAGPDRENSARGLAYAAQGHAARRRLSWRPVFERCSRWGVHAGQMVSRAPRARRTEVGVPSVPVRYVSACSTRY
jgi:hypothetical protein